MPKSKPSSRSTPSRPSPFTRPASKPKPPKPTSTPKDPKLSHLYTDDNPSTTLHGTGFKDAATAHRTLSLISARSLTYQFQTVNTMYHRAAHHPSFKKAAPGAASTANMRAAMDVFRHWLDVTYPEAKAGLRAEGFKPLLGKGVVERFLGRIEGCEGLGEEEMGFARVYVGLAKGKRLGNVLVDDGKPGEADWERRRYDVLDGLVGEGKEKGLEGWREEELWDGDGQVSDRHLRLIVWAWSPVKEARLLKL